jgi:cytochrome c oxidase subunit IV
MGQSYEQSKKTATKIIIILGIITIAEVIFALLGKGYIVEGLHFPLLIMGGVMIIMSLVKAYLIVYEFMHMKYEMPGLVKSVLLPTLLLVWAVFAFFKEGDYWKDRRGEIMDKNMDRVEEPVMSKEQGMLKELDENKRQN